MPNVKDEKVKAIIHEAAAEFFKLESDRTSMITVTRAELADRGKKALIYISVFPEQNEVDALSFSKRKRTELHRFLTKETKLPVVPFVDIIIDLGEKNRQKLESLKI